VLDAIRRVAWRSAQQQPAPALVFHPCIGLADVAGAAEGARITDAESSLPPNSPARRPSAAGPPTSRQQDYDNGARMVPNGVIMARLPK